LRASFEKDRENNRLEFRRCRDRTVLVLPDDRMLQHEAAARSQYHAAQLRNCSRYAFTLLAFCAGLRYQLHMSGDSIETLARRLAEAVPEGLKSVGEDLEQNFRSVLRAGLGKLDLVTREEFEVQEAVLKRSREMLEALEERLKALETAAESPPARKKTAKKASKKKSGKKSAG